MTAAARPPSVTDSDRDPGAPDGAPTKATRYDAWAYVIIGLLALPVLALGIGAIVLPPGISFSLVRRGLAEGRASWLVLGVLTGALWLLLLVVSIRRMVRAQPRDAAEDARLAKGEAEPDGDAHPPAPDAN